MFRFLPLIVLFIFHNAYGQYSAREYYDFGKSNVKDGKYYEAVDFLTRAIEEDPEFESARTAFSEVLSKV